MNYTIFDIITGQIYAVCFTNQIESQIALNQSYIEGVYSDSIYYIENNVPIEFPPKPSQYSVFDYTTKQWILDSERAISDVLEQRNKLLYGCDWTQIPNNPLTTEQQTAWATYRQELRDVPEQQGYPYNVVWPIAPT